MRHQDNLARARTDALLGGRVMGLQQCLDVRASSCARKRTVSLADRPRLSMVGSRPGMDWRNIYLMKNSLISLIWIKPRANTDNI